MDAYGMGDGLPWPGMRCGTDSLTTSMIEVGTLVLDMYDPAVKAGHGYAKTAQGLSTHTQLTHL